MVAILSQPQYGHSWHYCTFATLINHQMLRVHWTYYVTAQQRLIWFTQFELCLISQKICRWFSFAFFVGGHPWFILIPIYTFLVATNSFMNGPLHLSLRLSARRLPFSWCSCHCIIMKFSGVIIIDKGDVHTKGQGPRSRSQMSKQI